MEKRGMLWSELKTRHKTNNDNNYKNTTGEAVWQGAVHSPALDQLGPPPLISQRPRDVG